MNVQLLHLKNSILQSHLEILMKYQYKSNVFHLNATNSPCLFRIISTPTSLLSNACLRFTVSLNIDSTNLLKDECLFEFHQRVTNVQLQIHYIY